MIYVLSRQLKYLLWKPFLYYPFSLEWDHCCMSSKDEWLVLCFTLSLVFKCYKKRLKEKTICLLKNLT